MKDKGQGKKQPLVANKKTYTILSIQKNGLFPAEAAINKISKFELAGTESSEVLCKGV